MTLPYCGCFRVLSVETTMVLFILAELTRPDFTIYSGTPGCRNTWGMVKPFARDLEKHGYPTFIMYDDAFDDRVESWENTRARLEEFFTVRGLL